MASLNSCNFIGNVTRDPDSKFLPNGTAVCDFGLAINHTYTQNGEKREEVTFIDLTAFGRTAEIITEYAKKGKSVYIEARAKLDTWDDKTTGQKRSKVKFIVNNVQLLGGVPQGGQREAAPVCAGKPKDPDLDAPEDDIPF